MNAQGVSAKLARLVLAIRSERQTLFGTGVSEPDGWDVILILYLADADGRRLTARQLIGQVGGCWEAVKRRVAHLSRTGMIVGDGSGDLDEVVTLAPEAVTKMEELIERAWAGIRSV